MGGGKGVVDIEIAEPGEFVDESRIVLFLALVKAGVLQQQDVAVLHRGMLIAALGGDLADAIGREGDGLLEMLGERGGDRPQRIGYHRAHAWAGRNGRAGSPCPPSC